MNKSGFYLNIIIGFIVVNNCFSQELNYSYDNPKTNHIQNYFKEDTIYVVARSGLNIRTQPDKNSKVIEKVGFNKPIIFKMRSGVIDEIENRIGEWIKVEYNNEIVGYIFSGYVFKRKFPQEIIFSCYSVFGLESLLGINQDSIENTSYLMLGGELRYEKEKSRIRINQFDDGTSYNLYTGYEWVEAQIESYMLTQNDILNYLEYYLNKINEKCKDSEYYELPKIIIEKDNSNRVERIYLAPKHQIMFESIRFGRKTMIRFNKE